jgi:hypothetical protein
MSLDTKIDADFERYALELLRAAAVGQGKLLLLGNEAPRELAFTDAFAPHGLFDLPNPVFVEIHFQPTARQLKLAKKAHDSGVGPHSFLFVYKKVPKPLREQLERELRTSYPDLQYRIFDRPQLEELSAKHPDAALAFSQKYLPQAIDLFKRRDRAESSRRWIPTLQSAYREGRLVLFLGAGVSASARFPDWKLLLERMSYKLFKQHIDGDLSESQRQELFEYFRSEAPASPLIVARLLRDNLSSFAAEVRHALYQDTPCDASSDLVKEIGKLCLPQRSGRGLAAVVTYNYDELVEAELERRDISCRSVLSEAEDPLPSELPIYHVHGYLPRDGDLTEVHEECLVLSEDAYHNQFIDPYLWANIIQLNFLRNYVCLFIGLSLTDPNLRRLLEITVSKKPDVRHYAILQNHWTGEKAGHLSSELSTLPSVFRGLEEASLAKLGVSVIWADKHEETPSIISQIRAA